MLCMSDLIASCRCFCYLVTAVCDNIAQSNSCLCCVLLLLPTYCDSFLLFLLHTLGICFLSVMMFALGDRHCSESWQRKWRPSSGFFFSKGWCGGAVWWNCLMEYSFLKIGTVWCQLNPLSLLIYKITVWSLEGRTVGLYYLISSLYTVLLWLKIWFLVYSSYWGGPLIFYFQPNITIFGLNTTDGCPSLPFIEMHEATN
jgi:hypothetical protein